MIVIRNWAVRSGVAAPFALAFQIAISGCAPVADPSAGLTTTDAVALIDRASRSDLTPQAVADAFALNTRATDVQREMLEKDLVGRTVEWDLSVYEVAYSEGRFEVTSQVIPVADADAVPLLRVQALVRPQNESDDGMLRAVRTDDVIRIRGIVQEIWIRTIVVIVPAVAIVSEPT